MSGRTPGPWRWLDSRSLVGDHGRRPAVLTARENRQRDAATSLLVEFDPDSPDANLIAAAPDLLDACVSALKISAVACIQCAKPGTRLFDTEGDGPYWLCDSDAPDHGEEFYCGMELDDPLALVRAAITKAVAK